VKVTKKVKKFKKLVDIDASQSDSASDLEKAKVKRKKRALESKENDEKTQDESSAKRMNQELADEKELLQNGSIIRLFTNLGSVFFSVFFLSFSLRSGDLSSL
jgi:molybdopterin converting factor small subunit